MIGTLFADSLRVIGDTAAKGPIIMDMAERIARTLRIGGKLMVAGNGGSCADADHLVAELLVRLKPTFDRAPIRAINLTMGMSTLTACANDYGYDNHYARMVQAWGEPGDVLLVISTSGNSPNLINAVETASQQGVYTMGLLGSGGGNTRCDLSLIVDSHITGRIQEAHGVIIHALAELIEVKVCKNAQTT